MSHPHQNKIASFLQAREEEFKKEYADKITGHIYNGQCNYGDKPHKECRYPYNPGVEKPQGDQCLELEEKHLDIKSHIAETTSGLLAELRREIEGKKRPERIVKGQTVWLTGGEVGYNQALQDILSLLT